MAVSDVGEVHLWELKLGVLPEDTNKNNPTLIVTSQVRR